MKKNDKTRVNLIDLIKVFDERNVAYKWHTTPIIGLIGEDLNAAIFKDYLLRKKKARTVKVFSYPVNTGQMGGQGPRLDRWIKADKKLYQAEIKNWCSFQIGGYKLSLGTPESEVEELANEKWKRELREHY